jgi:hypothetical protein
MNDLKWEILSSEYLYRYDWFTARKDRCMTKEGKIIDPYFVLEYPDWVNAMALTEDNKVIIVRQYRHAWRNILKSQVYTSIQRTHRRRKG